MPIWLKEQLRPGVADDDSPAQAIPLKQATGAGLMGLLLGVTATALGVLVNWWLVLPYLLVMVWLLVPEGQLTAWEQSLKAPRSSPVPPPVATEVSERISRAEPAPAMDHDGAGAAIEAVAVKPKTTKRKRTTRKSRAVAVAPEPVVATWVQVGPGRFVRVEVAEPPADSPVAETTEEQPQPPIEPVEMCEPVETDAVEEMDPPALLAVGPEDLALPEPEASLSDTAEADCQAHEVEVFDPDFEDENRDEPESAAQDGPLAC